MVTFLGRHITETHRLGHFLVVIYGLGQQSSVKICKFFGLSYNALILSIDSEKLFFIQQCLERFSSESNLKRIVNDNIQAKIKLQSYAGLRISQGLPSRGQRTKTNSQTCKKFKRKLKILFKFLLYMLSSNSNKKNFGRNKFSSNSYFSKSGSNFKVGTPSDGFLLKSKFFRKRRKSKLHINFAHPRYVKAAFVSKLRYSKDRIKKQLRHSRSGYRLSRSSRLYYFNSRFSNLFFKKIKLPFYKKKSYPAGEKKFVLPFSKVKRSKVTKYSLFPFFGLGYRVFSTKNRYFYKRRKIFNFFKYNFFSKRTEAYISGVNFFSSIKYFLHVRQTKNNLFFFGKTSSGRLLFTYTNGQTVYKGSRRSTPTAAELAGKQVSKFLFLNRIQSVCLVFESPITSMIKSAVRGLSLKLDFTSMLARNFISHNGIKLKSTRRV